MEKVRTMTEAYRVFELLGIKDVTKKWQKDKGTEVWELPFKTYYGNGHSEINRFSVYKSGYIRKMVVSPTGANRSCWQLNKTYKTKEKWWNSYYKEYRTWITKKRILIDNHRDRIVYLCNYILRNYYQTDKWNLIGGFTKQQIEFLRKDYHSLQKHDLPFTEKCESETFTKDEVRVIINGHRYNLS